DVHSQSYLQVPLLKREDCIVCSNIYKLSGIPFIVETDPNAGMYGTLGNVQIIIPNETPCLECQPLIPERELQKACSLPGDVRKEKQMEKKVDIELNLSENSKISDEEYFPALGSVSSIIGGIMAHETLNLIHNSNDTHPVLDKYLFIDVHSQSYLQVPLLKREDCIVCSNIYKLSGIPFIVETDPNAGMYGTLGNVQIIIPNETPCLECQPLIPERELQKACSLPGDVRKEKQMEKKVDIELNLSENSKISDEEYFPALGSVSSIIGGIMAHETLNLIHNSNDTHPVLDKYLFIDVHSQSYLQVPLLKREDCIVCSNIYKLSGIPFIVEKGDTLKLFREKISLQFNLIKDSITISSLGQDLTEDEIFLQEILEETSSVYIFADELPLPMKIQIQWLN
ncbi:MAG: hypothetical protein HeimC3_02720, partial [Candidatus Heimdallarchaeota archaeon LC_3]